MKAIPGDEKVSFVYNGKRYTGQVVSSTRLEPHFHWFMFDDPEAIEQYGDSIAFKIENGVLIPLYHLTAPDFVSAVHRCVQEYLENSGRIS
jgi:hypothetical protein